MLSEKAHEFSEYLTNKEATPLTFKNMMSFDRTNFKGAQTDKQKEQNSKYYALGAATLLAITGLGFLSFKNLRQGKKYMRKILKLSKKL